MGSGVIDPPALEKERGQGYGLLLALEKERGLGYGLGRPLICKSINHTEIPLLKRSGTAHASLESSHPVAPSEIVDEGDASLVDFF